MSTTKDTRNQQLVRILQLLNMLSNNPLGYTIHELQERLRVTRRTMYRDVEALSDAGIYLTRERTATRHVRYKLPHEYRFIKTSFDENELFSLFFAKNLLKPLDGTPFARGMQSALDKIYKLLPEDVQATCFFTESFFLFKQPFAKPYREYEKTIRTLKEAILADRKCTIEYRKEDAADHHTIHPYFVTYVDGLLYVVAHSELRNEKRTFRIDRISSIQVLEQLFERPDDFKSENFDAERVLGRSLKIYSDEHVSRVEIEFAKPLATYMRDRVWHATQEIKDLGGGRIRLSMELPINPELMSWILSFGANARVLKPPELVRQVSAQLAEGSRLYS